jgi:hypothetical protein
LIISFLICLDKFYNELLFQKKMKINIRLAFNAKIISTKQVNHRF